MPDGNSNDKYFALKLGTEYIDAVRQFELNWKWTCEDRGLWHLWYLIYCASLGINPDTGAINSNQQVKFAGQQQQYAMFRVQLTRRLIAQRVMMAKDERPSFTGVAINNEVESLAQVNISSRAVEYQLRTAKLEQRASECLESLGYFGGGALMNTWDYNAGELVPVQEPEIDPETGQPMMMPDFHPETGQQIGEKPMMKPPSQKKSGAPGIVKLYPWQTAVEPYRESDHLVVVTKRPVNKYEYAAKFPEKAKDIIKEQIESELGDDAIFAWGSPGAISSDTVILREVFHADCDAIPGGRWSGHIGKVGLWGVDEILPCPLDSGIPVKFMVGPRYWGTSFGYPESSDLLALQAVLNEAISQAVTNLQKRGSPNAYKRDDVQIDQRAFSMGNNLVDLPAGADKPEWDEPPELGGLLPFVVDFVVSQAEQMLGGNPTALGKPDANITSGAFGVLMVNIAQRYANQFQETYDVAITDTANDSLELTKKNATHGFWAQIAGVDDGPYVELITQDKLSSLKRVMLVRQSPVLSTFPGRVEVFDRLAKLPKRERFDASEMLLSGRMDAFTSRDQAQKLRIRKENQMMLAGIAPTVTAWDDHALEGPEHRAVYDKLRTQDEPSDKPQGPPPPDGPQGPQFLQWQASAGPKWQAWKKACQLFDDHLQQHAMALETAPASFAAVSGWQPLPQPEAPPGAPAPGASSQGQGPAAGKLGDKQGPQMPERPKAPKPPPGINGPVGNQPQQG